LQYLLQYFFNSLVNYAKLINLTY